MARYERLRGWALHLSSDDRAAAEDLLQEAFVQFTATNTDLGAIQNLDAYLFGMIRILHLSQMRRARRRTRLLSTVLDYNAAILGLRDADPHDQLLVREELLHVCRYACARKETSKAGSVLLLRFFLGYYPGEIARVTKSTRGAVEERLRIARAEAKSYLRDPASLKVIGAQPQAGAAPEAEADPAQPPDAFLQDIRRRIALSSQGECLPGERLGQIYRGEGAIDCPTLAHLVSCEGCLETVNKLLGIPLLSERHPIDSLGKDTGKGPGRGGDGGNTGGGGGGADDLRLRRGRNRAREVFEHDPGELCMAVNGDRFCSQIVGGGHNEQTLNVERPVEFVEVFSEQGVRLLLLIVGAQPPDGPARHTARAALSDGRSLEIALELNCPTSTLRVVYEDHHRQWKAQAEETGSCSAEVTVEPPATGARPPSGARASRWRVRGIVGANLRERLARWFAVRRPWLRPGVVTAVLSLLLVGALLFVRSRVGTVSAPELLSRSAVAERADAGDREAVTHRTLYLEEHDSAGGGARRQRVEVWHSEARRVTVRHVYDEAGAFRIGERVTGDGERLVVLPDAKPFAGRESRPAAPALLAAGAAWRLSPSAADYLDLTGGAAFASVEEAGSNYVVRHMGDAGAGVVEAVLVIRKDDLHAVEMRVAYAGDSGRREYRLVEGLFERPPPEQIPPKLFEAGDDVSGAGGVGAVNGVGHAAAGTPAAAASAGPARASAELEVEVNYLLQRLGSNLSEQVAVRRTPDDRLRVEALVETAQRKKEILAALGPVASNPAVTVEVSTVAEAEATRARRGTDPTKELDVEVRDDARDAEAELASKLGGARNGDEERAIEEVARISERVLADSRRAVQHAAALSRLTASFPLRVSAPLDPAAREKLLEMIRANAEGYRRNVRDIAKGLAPFSSAQHGGAGEAVVITTDADLARAVERLSRLTRENNEAVHSALALSQRGQSLAPIKSRQFWDSLDAAEKLSLAILQAYRQ